MLNIAQHVSPRNNHPLNFPRPTVIGVDFNNTIQNQIATIIALSGWKLTWQDFDRWDPPIGHKIGLSEAQFIDWAWKNPSLQMMSLPFPGVREAMRRLKCQGHFLRIVTSTCLPRQDLVSWLYQNRIIYDEIIMTKDKSQVDFDVLIDDSPIVINQMLELGRKVIKFNLPWNQDINCPGFSDWSQVQVAR